HRRYGLTGESTIARTMVNPGSVPGVFCFCGGYMSTVPFHSSQRAQQTEDQPISYFMQQAIENPELISLAAGLVDPETLPADEVSVVLDEILSDPRSAQAALQYGTTQGYLPLRA